MAVASHKDNLYMLKQLHVVTAEAHDIDQHAQPSGSRSNLFIVWYRWLGHIGFWSLQHLASLGHLGLLTTVHILAGLLYGQEFEKYGFSEIRILGEFSAVATKLHG